MSRNSSSNNNNSSSRSSRQALRQHSASKYVSQRWCIVDAINTNEAHISCIRAFRWIGSLSYNDRVASPTQTQTQTYIRFHLVILYKYIFFVLDAHSPFCKKIHVSNPAAANHAANKSSQNSTAAAATTTAILEIKSE